MPSDFLSSYLPPIALGLMMMGMGLSLRPEDFSRLLTKPKAVFVGLLGQMIGLPLLGLLTATIFTVTNTQAAGIMILVTCAGGVVSGLLTQIVKGDTALSITMTSISMLFGIITIPLLVNVSLNHFLPQSDYIALDLLGTSLRLLLITVLPVTTGMLFRYLLPQLSLRLQPKIAFSSNILLAAMILLTMIKYLNEISHASAALIIPLFSLNIMAMLLGYIFSQIARLDNIIAKTLVIEIGIQNSATAIFIASILLNNTLLALPAIIYTGIAFINFALFMFTLRINYGYTQKI
jgi:BASS family bile acid:Na+ symporter